MMRYDHGTEGGLGYAVEISLTQDLKDPRLVAGLVLTDSLF